MAIEIVGGIECFANAETGELMDESVEYTSIYAMQNGDRLVTKQKIENYKTYLENKKPDIKTLTPFVRMSISDYINEKIDALPQKTQAQVFKIVRSIDIFGRIKHGENYQQYCRTFNDLLKIDGINVGESAPSIRSFKKYLLQIDIIREIVVNDNKYIVFNPIFACSGREISIIQWMAFRDVIISSGFVNEKQIEIMDDELAKNGVLFG